MLAVVIAGLLAAGITSLVAVGDGEGDRAEAPLPPGHALLRGVVADSDTGIGVEGATIRVDHAGGPTSVRTDAKGRYEVVVDASRPVALTADAPGRPGLAAFARLCDGERRDVRLEFPPPESAAPPPAPMVLSGPCG